MIRQRGGPLALGSHEWGAERCGVTRHRRRAALRSRAGRVLISTTVAPAARAAKSSRRVARSEAPSTAPTAKPTTPDRSPSSSAHSASISVAGAVIRKLWPVGPNGAKPPANSRPRSRNQARGAATISPPRHAPSPAADSRNPSPAATPLAPSTHTSSNPAARVGAGAVATSGPARIGAGRRKGAEAIIVHYLFLFEGASIHTPAKTMSLALHLCVLVDRYQLPSQADAEFSAPLISPASAPPPAQSQALLQRDEIQRQPSLGLFDAEVGFDPARLHVQHVGQGGGAALHAQVLQRRRAVG